MCPPCLLSPCSTPGFRTARRRCAIVLLPLLLFWNLTGCSSNLFVERPKTFATQEEAGSTHVAVLSVGRWQDYLNDLQPSFKFDEKAAFDGADAATRMEEDKFETFISAALKVTSNNAKTGKGGQGGSGDSQAGGGGTGSGSGSGGGTGSGSGSAGGGGTGAGGGEGGHDGRLSGPSGDGSGGSGERSLLGDGASDNSSTSSGQEGGGDSGGGQGERAADGSKPGEVSESQGSGTSTTNTSGLSKEAQSVEGRATEGESARGRVTARSVPLR